MATRATLAEQIQLLYYKLVNSNKSLKKTLDRREVFILINQAANDILATAFLASTKLGDITVPTCLIASYQNIPVVQVNGIYTCTLPIYPMQLPNDMGVWAVVPQAGAYPNLVDGIPFIPITTSDWDLLRSTDVGLLEGQVGYFVEGKTVCFTQYPATIVVTFNTLIGGTGYETGTYANVPLTWVSGTVPTSTIIANITVTAGIVTSVTYVSGGIGADSTTTLSASSANIGAGTGFSIKVATDVSTAYPVKVKLLISDPTLIGDNDPYPVTPDMELQIIEAVLALLAKGATQMKDIEIEEN